MAEFCKECFLKIENNIDEIQLLMSDTSDLCEGCGETKPIVLQVIPQLTVAECKVETQKHIETVRKYIRFMIDKLDTRGVKHDSSKLESPEVELFAKYTPLLANTTYGSEQYKQQIDGLKPALEHHYATSRHHPEHFKNGIADMTLVDLMEMFCDWKASTLRHNDGNLLTSIDINAERFHIDDQLKQILINTARMIDEHED